MPIFCQHMMIHARVHKRKLMCICVAIVGNKESNMLTFGTSEIKHQSYLKLFGGVSKGGLLPLKNMFLLKMNYKITYVLFSREEDHWGLSSFYKSEMQAISRNNIPSSNTTNATIPV